MSGVIFIFYFSLFIFRGYSIREPASSRVTYFILRAYIGTCVSRNYHEKNSREVLEKNAGEWTRRVAISKEEIPGSKRILTTPGLKGRTVKLCVLHRWGFNVCVSSSPLRGRRRRRWETDTQRDGEVAQLAQHRTGTWPTQVRVPCAKRDFSPSYLSVQTLLRCPYTPVCNHPHLHPCAR